MELLFADGHRRGGRAARETKARFSPRGCAPHHHVVDQLEKRGIVVERVKLG
jgi:hypothetical protein